MWLKLCKFYVENVDKLEDKKRGTIAIRRTRTYTQVHIYICKKKRCVTQKKGTHGDYCHYYSSLHIALFWLGIGSPLFFFFLFEFVVCAVSIVVSSFRTSTYLTRFWYQFFFLIDLRSVLPIPFPDNIVIVSGCEQQQLKWIFLRSER